MFTSHRLLDPVLGLGGLSTHAAPMSVPDPDDSRAPAILVSVLVLQIFATIFFATRVISRVVIARRWRSEDWLLLLAWAVSVTLTALQCLSLNHGSGRHQYTLSKDDIVRVVRLSYLSRILYLAATAFTKLSICALFIHFVNAERWESRAMFVCGCYVVTSFLAFEIQAIIPCRPLSRVWNPTLDTAVPCLTDESVTYSSAAINTASTVWIVLVASWRVFRLILPFVRKALLCLLIIIGWVVVVAGILRIVRISSIISGEELGEDYSWQSFETTLWTAMEVNLGIFCASSAMLGPFIGFIATGSLKGSRRTTQDRSMEPSTSIDAPQNVSIDGANLRSSIATAASSEQGRSMQERRDRLDSNTPLFGRGMRPSVVSSYQDTDRFTIEEEEVTRVNTNTDSHRGGFHFMMER